MKFNFFKKTTWLEKNLSSRALRAATGLGLGVGLLIQSISVSASQYEIVGTGEVEFVFVPIPSTLLSGEGGGYIEAFISHCSALGGTSYTREGVPGCELPQGLAFQFRQLITALENDLSAKLAEDEGKGVPGGGTSGPTQAAQTETEPTETAGAQGQPSQPAGTDQEPAEPAQQPGQPTSGEQQQQQQQQGGLSPQEQADLKDAVEACERAHKEATEACNQPFKKAFGVDLGPDDMQMIMTVLNVGGQTALASRAGSQKSMAKACGMMRDVGYATTALNAGFATQCQSFRSSCLTQCQHLESIMRQVVARCENDPACSVSQQVSLNNTSQRVAACQQYSGQVAGMATQALMALYSAEGASMCRDLAKAQDFGLPPPKTSPPANRPNCADPANASNPVCLECRSPESRNNPMCRDVNAQIPGGDGRSNQSSRTPPGGNDGEDFDLSNLGLEDDPNQMAQMPITEPGEASARRPSGSGTGLGGGGGPQGYDGAPGGHGDPGIDTDILHGVGGGGGYTTSSVPFSSGGGGGGFGLPPRPDSAGEKFDLRKFLPGRQGVKGLQKVTGGEGRRHPELAPSHDNIWRRVSNKYQQLCQRGELYGCQ